MSSTNGENYGQAKQTATVRPSPLSAPDKVSGNADTTGPPTGHKSIGVLRIEAIYNSLTTTSLTAILVCIFLVGYAYGLDATVRNVYTTYATASYQKHSLLATVNVLRTVFAAGAQFTSSRLADGFGRVEVIGLAIVFYLVGSIVEATSTGVDSYAAGAVIWQVGMTSLQTIVTVLIGDLTSTRLRLFAVYIPNLHFAITTWVSGNITSAVLKNTTWQWGIGMWCIIITICVAPLVGTLLFLDRRAQRMSSQRSTAKRLSLVETFWRLDTIGLLLLVAIVALILTPFTIAGGIKTTWKTAHVIAPLVIGFVCIPLFVLWERRAPQPLVRLQDLKDRGVWSPIALSITTNFAYALQGNYLYTLLVIAFSFSVKAATRITSLYLFTSFVVGPFCGLFVYWSRHMKYLVVAGTVLYMVAFGLLIRYRGDSSSSSRSGVIGAEVLLGIGGGMFPYAALSSLQVALKHEQMAIMTGVFLASHSIGHALGASVSGAIWSQVLPSTLEEKLSFQSNATLSRLIYANPFAVAAHYPVGTPIREAINSSYRHVQMLLCVTGLCLCIPLVGFALCFRNPELTAAQTLAKEDDGDGSNLAHSPVDSERHVKI
ncbi:ferrioxamine B transporter [Rhinocladiella similis]